MNTPPNKVKHYIVKATKDIGILIEGTIHLFEISKRKAKKAFKKTWKQWRIIDIIQAQ